MNTPDPKYSISFCPPKPKGAQGDIELVPMDKSGLLKMSNPDKLHIRVTNNGLTSKVFRLFGGDTGLPVVDNNVELNSDVSLVANLAVPGFPFDYTISGNYAYVSVQPNGNISVIDLTTGTIVNTLSTNPFPKYLLVYGNYLYITNSNIPNEIYLTNLLTGIPAPNILISPDAEYNDLIFSYGSKIYVGIKPCALAVIEPSTNTVSGFIDFDESQGDIKGVIISNGLFYCSIANGGGSNAILAVANPSLPTFVSKVTLSVGTPLQQAIIEYNGYIYISLFDVGLVEVYEISSGTVVETISIGVTAFFLIEVGGYIYVSNYAENSISKINPSTNTVIATYSIPGGPSYFTFINNYLYISLTDLGAIGIFDVNIGELVDTIITDDGSTIVFESGQLTYSLNTSGGTISVLSTVSDDQVLVIVNGEQTTIQELNQMTRFNPICFKELIYDASNRNSFKNILSYKVKNSSGFIESHDISLLQKFTAYNSNKVNTVKLDSSDFPDCVLDGSHYLQNQVDPGVTLNFDFKYSELRINYPPTGCKEEKIVKKYSQAKFKFLKSK